MTGDVELTHGTKRFAALDLSRGIVCLYIVLEHAGVMLWQGIGDPSAPDGWLRRLIFTPLQWHIGTPLFFVMSGYCVLASVDAHKRRGDSAGHFLGRRFRRIFPSYWAAFLLFVVVVLGLDWLGLALWHQNSLALQFVSPAELSLPQWIGNITLTETWRPRVFGGEELVFTRIAWSLCYQEQFYLICFLVLALVPGRFHKVMGVLSVMLILAAGIAADVGLSRQIEGFCPVKWHEFAIGFLVYWVISGRFGGRVRRAVVGSLMLIGVGSFVLGDARTLAAALFGLLLIGMERYDNALARWRPLDWVRACGARSYSIYLAHLPVVLVVANLMEALGVQEFWAKVLIAMPVTVGAALAFSWLFDAWIDAPLARASRKRPTARSIKAPTGEATRATV